MAELTPLDQCSDSELTQLARHSRGAIAKESLAALARRRHDQATPIAVDLLTAHADPDVRSLAAVTLGRLRDPDAPAALQRALADSDASVVRRAAQSLVRVGGPDALTELNRRSLPRDPVAARAVLTARMLLGYRLGRTDALVTAGDVTDFGRRRGESITFGTRASMSKAAITASIETEVPALPFSASGVRLFACSGVSGALALSDEVDDVDLSAPQMLGVLVRERVCSERFSLDCYLLSDDRDGTRGTQPRLWLVRPSGRVVHTGSAKVEDDRTTFAVTGSVAPYANPVKVVGTRAATGTITIETALVGKPAVGATRAVEPLIRERMVR